MPRESEITWAKIARRIRVPVGFAFTALYIWLARPSGKSILAGAIFIALGVFARALASGQLNKNEQLAVSGPYAYTRNPLYLGSLILALGFAIAAQNLWVVAVIAIIFAGIYVPVIRSEEAFLRAKFPEFDDYAREVPRLIPRMISPRRYDYGFSWDLYLKHREYNAALGSAALMAALIAKLLWVLHHSTTNSIS
jgi:protein-S-isoprenylcysteine O-methyltransferase Ste14